jgi:hypothetical protein
MLVELELELELELIQARMTQQPLLCAYVSAVGRSPPLHTTRLAAICYCAFLGLIPLSISAASLVFGLEGTTNTASQAGLPATYTFKSPLPHVSTSHRGTKAGNYLSQLPL